MGCYGVEILIRDSAACYFMLIRAYPNYCLNSKINKRGNMFKNYMFIANITNVWIYNMFKISIHLIFMLLDYLVLNYNVFDLKIVVVLSRIVNCVWNYLLLKCVILNTYMFEAFEYLLIIIVFYESIYTRASIPNYFFHTQ